MPSLLHVLLAKLFQPLSSVTMFVLFIGKLSRMYQTMCNQETVPQEFKDVSIGHLYKWKGNMWAYDNHRGISLLCIAGKILVRIMPNHLNQHFKQDWLPESQCGFCQSCGKVDMVFAARQFQEKCQEQNFSLYTTFMDLTKAFDTVSHDGPWKTM